MKPKSISLVLGSGGARGLAHIGIIHWLQEHNFKIESISGASIGALVGGVFASGQLDEFEQWIRAIDKVDILKLLDFSLTGNGLIKGDKVIDTLIDLVGDKKIEDLDIHYTAVASNIKLEKEVWIKEGRLFDAIRASIAIPLFFTPFKLNDNFLLDGGILNPVPIAPTFGDGTDLTIAVNLGGPVEPGFEKEEKAELETENTFLQLKEKIGSFINKLPKIEIKKEENDWGAYDIVNQAIDAMQSTIARQKLAAYPPDHVIEIARNSCGILEFDRANEMIELGYRKAEQTLKYILTENK